MRLPAFRTLRLSTTGYAHPAADCLCQEDLDRKRTDQRSLSHNTLRCHASQVHPRPLALSPSRPSSPERQAHNLEAAQRGAIKQRGDGTILGNALGASRHIVNCAILAIFALLFVASARFCAASSVQVLRGNEHKFEKTYPFLAMIECAMPPTLLRCITCTSCEFRRLRLHVHTLRKLAEIACRNGLRDASHVAG